MTHNYEEDCEYIISKGYSQKTLFFKTGGGEDENDISIFVKGLVALTFGWDARGKWSIGKYGQCCYNDGFDNYSSVIDIYKYEI